MRSSRDEPRPQYRQGPAQKASFLRRSGLQAAFDHPVILDPRMRWCVAWLLRPFVRGLVRLFCCRHPSVAIRVLEVTLHASIEPKGTTQFLEAVVVNLYNAIDRCSVWL